jgi:hypothetical protein
MKKTMMLIGLGCLILMPVYAGAVTVDWVSGDVTYSRQQGAYQALDVGASLSAGDRVKTGFNSDATLLDNGSEIHILENSEFTVSERYVGEKRKPAFLLFLGRMRFKLGKSGEEEPDIHTQTVNLTIRGTEFEVGSGYDGSTIVLMNEGTVEVKGADQSLVLTQGEGTEVAFGEEPTTKFRVMERVIDWTQWIDESRDAVKGNETALLSRIRTRMQGIRSEILDLEGIRENAQGLKDQYLAERDSLLDQGNQKAAVEASQKAGTQSRLAFHSLVNIRFLALSSIGLKDMAERIYTGVAEPTAEMGDLFGEINLIYDSISAKYIVEGDRERLEKTVEKRTGCSSLF